MHIQIRKTTETFARPFQLDGLEKLLPAGVYSAESENDVLDGMFLPECLRKIGTSMRTLQFLSMGWCADMAPIVEAGSMSQGFAPEKGYPRRCAPSRRRPGPEMAEPSPLVSLALRAALH